MKNIYKALIFFSVGLAFLILTIFINLKMNIGRSVNPKTMKTSSDRTMIYNLRDEAIAQAKAHNQKTYSFKVSGMQPFMMP